MEIGGRCVGSNVVSWANVVAPRAPTRDARRLRPFSSVGRCSCRRACWASVATTWVRPAPAPRWSRLGIGTGSSPCVPRRPAACRPPARRPSYSPTARCAPRPASTSATPTVEVRPRRCGWRPPRAPRPPSSRPGRRRAVPRNLRRFVHANPRPGRGGDRPRTARGGRRRLLRGRRRGRAGADFEAVASLFPGARSSVG
jgi:hypothetical protein